jgi:hypothetical protein
MTGKKQLSIGRSPTKVVSVNAEIGMKSKIFGISGFLSVSTNSPPLSKAILENNCQKRG